MDNTRHFSRGEIPAINALVADLGLPSDTFDGQDFVLRGNDPVIRSPHQLGNACATVIGLSALLAAAIYRLRTGRDNTAQLNIEEALHHLHDSHYMWQNGYKIGVGAESVPLNSFFTCSDGRAIHTMAGPPYMKLLNGYLNFYDCGNNRQSIAKAAAEYTALELEEALNRAGLPACVARTRDEWLAHPVGEVLGATPAIKITRISDGAPEAFLPSPESALSGLKVLDFTHVLAGPLCAQNQALLGADVLHITSPYYRDTIAQTMAGNFGKKNAYLDLNQDSDRITMQDLQGEADIFINSYRPGVTGRFGIDIDSALERQISPDGSGPNKKQNQIFVDVSCYGTGHSWSDRVGFETIGQACTGFSVTEANGDLAKPKFSPVFYLTDPLTSYLALAGTLAAVYRRALEGGSWHVEISLVRTAMWVQELGILPESVYASAPEEDNYPYQTQELDTAMGRITKLKDPFVFNNMALCHQNLFVPFGRDKASFD